MRKRGKNTIWKVGGRGNPKGKGNQWQTFGKATYEFLLKQRKERCETVAQRRGANLEERGGGGENQGIGGGETGGKITKKRGGYEQRVRDDQGKVRVGGGGVQQEKMGCSFSSGGGGQGGTFGVAKRKEGKKGKSYNPKKGGVGG